MKTDLDILKKILLIMIKQIVNNTIKFSNCSDEWRDFKKEVLELVDQLEIPIRKVKKKGIKL